MHIYIYTMIKIFYDTIYIIWISLPESKSKRSCSKENPKLDANDESFTNVAGVSTYSL